MTRGNSFAIAVALLVAPRFAGAQDLFERWRSQGARGSATAEVYRAPDRLDLRLGATFPTSAVIRDQGYGRLGFEGVFESDFACGRFDVRANLKSLISKEVRDEFVEALLGAVESELMYNALVLACEVSPTACDAFKHFRVNANAMLGIGYDRCAAVEQAVNDGLHSARAKSIKDCLNRKQGEGATMDEAMRACDRAGDVTGLLGGRVAEFNLGQELVKAFNLDGGDARQLETMLSKLRYTPQGVRGDVEPDAVLREYARVEKEIATAWIRAADQAARDPKAPLDPEVEKVIAPTWTSGPFRIGLLRIAELPRDVRQLRIQLLASRAAAVELTLQVQKLERILAGAELLPQNSEERRREIARQRELLRLQLQHMDELVARKQAYQRDLLGTLDHGETVEHARAASQVGRAQAAKDDEWLRKEVAKPWGAKGRPPEAAERRR